MSILKVVGVGLIAAVISLLVKSFRPEISLQITIVAGASLLIYAVIELSGIADTLMTTANKYGLNTEYIGIIFKALGLSYITQFASDICRDAGETAIAGKVELCGKVMIVACAIPGVLTLLDMVSSLLKQVA